MTDPSLSMLLNAIDRAFDQRSWHGTNLRGALRGVTPEQALYRPAPGVHTIWEITLHAAYWKYIVRRKLLNEKRGSFPLKGSDWFKPGESTPIAWKRDVRLLVDTHKSMRQAIAGLTPKQINHTPPDRKVSDEVLITGIAAHDLHHAGQIQLLKRLSLNKQRKNKVHLPSAGKAD